MSKAREIAELGQKLTVDAYGNLDIAGSVEANTIQVEGATGSLINVYRASANANFDAITFKDTTNTNINAKIGWNANELRLEGTNTIRLLSGGNASAIFGSNGDTTLYRDDGSTIHTIFDASNGFTDHRGTVKISSNQNDPNDSSAGYITNKSGWGPTVHGFRFRVNAGATGAHTNVFAVGQSMGAVFNEDSQDHDFRVESDTSTHMLFVDAGNNSIGINSSSTYDYAQTVAVGNTKAEFNATQWSSFSGAQDGSGMFAQNLYRWHDGVTTRTSYTNTHANIGGAGVLVGAGWNTGKLVATNSAATAGAEATNLKTQLTWQTDQVIVNDDGDANIDFRVESDTNANAFVVDAATSIVYIGAPSDVANNAQPKLSITTPWKASSSSDYDGTLSLVATGGGASGGRGPNIIFTGEDGASARTLAKIDAIKENSTSGDHDGALIFRTRKNASGLPARLHLMSYAAIFNDDSDDTDFIVESNNLSHLLYVDAGNDVVNFNSTQTESLIGADLPAPSNGIRHVKRFYQVEASGYFSSTIGGTTGPRYHALDVEMVNLQGAVLDLYLTGHFYNNGGDTYMHHYQVYLMCESTNFRIGNVVSRGVYGSNTGACGTPSVSMAANGVMRLSWATSSGYQLYGSATITGPGTNRLHNYGWSY